MTRHIKGVLPIVFTFLMGIANFAMHRAVMDAYHDLFAQMSPLLRHIGGRGSMLAEFVLLLGAMLLVAYGHPGWGLAYLLYTLLNAASAWLLFSGKF